MPSKTGGKTARRQDGKTKAAAPKGGELRVKQVRSGIGHPKGHRRTLEALGLRHHQDVTTVKDTPSIRGMLFQVRHLIEVTPAGAK